MIDPMTALGFSVYENKGIYALLLGSGLSRSAQIPTGWDITLDLTRRVGALEGATAQGDWAAWYKERFGEAPSYSKLLDILASTPAERRSILHRYIEPSAEEIENGEKKPTKAHHAIARMVRDGFFKVLITTNFDRLMENALREAGVEPTVIKSGDDLAGSVPLAHSRCFLLKLHGDYLDTRLLNTDTELGSYNDSQNSVLDRILDEYGLIVSGWSGDWDAALRDAISRAPNRRYPTFWASRGTPSETANDLIRHRNARVLKIEDADTFFTGLQQRLETLDAQQRAHPLTIDMIVGAAKRYLSDTTHRIQLAELVIAETGKAQEVISSLGYTAQGQYSDAQFISRVVTYENSYEALCRVAFAMGRWGQGEETNLAADILQNLARQPVQNGLVLWNKLMTYPASLFFTSYALGAAKTGRLQVLNDWLLVPIPQQRREQDLPAFRVLFGEMWAAGDDKNWDLFTAPERFYSPFNNHVLKVCLDWFASDFFDRTDIEFTFEWLELLVGMAMTLDGVSKEMLANVLAGTAGQRDYLWSAIGRVAWHSDHQERLLSRLAQGPISEALMATKFLGVDREILDLLGQNFRKVIANQRWR